MDPSSCDPITFIIWVVFEHAQVKGYVFLSLWHPLKGNITRSSSPIPFLSSLILETQCKIKEPRRLGLTFNRISIYHQRKLASGTSPPGDSNIEVRRS